MNDPHSAKMDRLVDAVLTGDGTLEPDIRRAAARRLKPGLKAIEGGM
jgi:hypothetical protein